MELSPQEIVEFQKLYLKRYCIAISEDETRRIGTKLIDLVRTVYKSMPMDEHDQTTDMRARDEQTFERTRQGG